MPESIYRQDVARRINRLPALTIKDVKVITTSAGGRYRWVFVKIVTSEPGLCGIGSANNTYQTAAVIDDVLPPEQIAWYRNIRQVCSTPQAIGEVFSDPLEVIPLVTDRLIDFVRCRVAAMGGITPVRKLAVMCETVGVKTAFQEGGENDPVNQLAAYHIDLSSSAFGIQEENHFPPVVHDMFPGMAEIRKGYLYDSGKPGLGIDINEGLAAKHPLGPIPNGGPYKTDRTIDGTVVKP